MVSVGPACACVGVCGCGWVCVCVRVCVLQCSMCIIVIEASIAFCVAARALLLFWLCRIQGGAITG